MRNFLEKASKAYYEGKPIISDIEFDMLAKKYNFDDVAIKLQMVSLTIFVCTHCKNFSILQKVLL